MARKTTIEHHRAFPGSGMLALVFLNWLPGFCPDHGIASPLSLYQFEEAGMGTRFTVQVYSASLKEVEPVVAAAWTRLADLNRCFSDYDPGSELMRFCHQAPGTRVKLSPELHEILSISQNLSRETMGAFDVTVGPLKRLWKQSCRDGRLPPAGKLAEALARTGYQKLHLYEDGSASLSGAGMRLDLGGIAKGYAARELLRHFVARGFPKVLVAASGDIAVGEPPPGKTGWRIGIVTPERPFDMPPHSAVSTSGDSEQFAEIDGVRYSHILDPRTGIGLTRGITVSVNGPDPVMTDALATAVSVLGSPDQIPASIRRQYQILLLPRGETQRRCLPEQTQSSAAHGSRN